LKQYNGVLKSQEIFEARQMAPEGKIPATAPDGSIKYIWRDQAEKAVKRGYKIL
jgi:hypothetical protein